MSESTSNSEDAQCPPMQPNVTWAKDVVEKGGVIEIHYPNEGTYQFEVTKQQDGGEN